MATIPTYERQVTPSGRGVLPNRGVDDSMASALGMAAGQLQKVADQMYRQQVEQQDQIRALEFAKLKGELDGQFNEFYMAESENPDYEGMKERGKAFASEKRQAMLEGIKDKQVRMAVEKYFAAKIPAMDLDLAKLYLAKQTDHRNALFYQAYEQNVLNNDRAGLASLVAGATWMDETQRQNLLSKGGREISWNSAMKDMRDNLDGWTFDGERYSGLDEQQVIQLKEQHETLIDRRDRDIERAKREQYAKSEEVLWQAYFSGGRISKAELGSMAKRGEISIEMAARWDSTFTSRAEAEANRRERQANESFRRQYRQATPEQRELLTLQHDFGTSPETSKKTYVKFSEAIESGTFKPDELQDALDDGLIGTRQAKRLLTRYKELDKETDRLYTIALRANKKKLQDTLRAIEVDSYEYMSEYDTLAVRGTVPQDKLDDFARGLIKKALDDSGYKRLIGPAWNKKAKAYDNAVGYGAWLPDQPAEEDFF